MHDADLERSCFGDNAGQSGGTYACKLVQGLTSGVSLVPSVWNPVDCH